LINQTVSAELAIAMDTSFIPKAGKATYRTDFLPGKKQRQVGFSFQCSPYCRKPGKE
jgi:hypothetical protein